MRTPPQQGGRLPLLGAWILLAALAVLMGERQARCEGSNEVVVVYNSAMPESKELAEYYAKRRNIPRSRLFGFDLPKTEGMSREQFTKQLQEPLFRRLETSGLFRIETQELPKRPGETWRRVVGSDIRFAALCYGVPVRIEEDSKLREENAEKLRSELRRNEAAVDSELALLPLLGGNLSYYGPLKNPVYGVTNAAWLHPTNGVLLVSRLDGPSVEVARGLIDKAIQAETDGLWGRAYFDSRGLTNGTYLPGDLMIRDAAAKVRRYGFETVHDDSPGTFSAHFPMSQIAIYAGWYDGRVSGPFTRPKVEFMPGAVAYHLHSYSAVKVRTASEYWVGPLLQRGATATMGCVAEPYLEGTPDFSGLISRMMFLHFRFGEAAYACQGVLSWQTTVIGDPLYRPFYKHPKELHDGLAERGSPLLEWSHLRVVNLLQQTGESYETVVGYLHEVPLTAKSAVLTEKLADVYFSRGKFSEAIEAYGRVLELNPTPQQQIRVMLTSGRYMELLNRWDDAYKLYQDFVKTFPDYPDLETVYKKLIAIGQQMDKAEDLPAFHRALERLTGGGKS